MTVFDALRSHSCERPTTPPAVLPCCGYGGVFLDDIDQLGAGYLGISALERACSEIGDR